MLNLKSAALAPPAPGRSLEHRRAAPNGVWGVVESTERASNIANYTFLEYTTEDYTRVVSR